MAPLLCAVPEAIRFQHGLWRGHSSPDMGHEEQEAGRSLVVWGGSQINEAVGFDSLPDPGCRGPLFLLLTEEEGI